MQEFHTSSSALPHDSAGETSHLSGLFSDLGWRKLTPFSAKVHTKFVIIPYPMRLPRGYFCITLATHSLRLRIAGFLPTSLPGFAD